MIILFCACFSNVIATFVFSNWTSDVEDPWTDRWICFAYATIFDTCCSPLWIDCRIAL